MTFKNQLLNYSRKIKVDNKNNLHFLICDKYDSEFFLCLHGQPTWSYIYRNFMNEFENRKLNFIVPDFIGFGLSDKPTDTSYFTFDQHRLNLITLLEELGINKVNLICQDWGGIIGLTLPYNTKIVIEKLMVMNTILPELDFKLPQGFMDWKNWANANKEFKISKLMKRACPGLSNEDLKNYDLPFEKNQSRSGTVCFPNLLEPMYSEKIEFFKNVKKYWTSQKPEKTCIVWGMNDPVFDHKVLERIKKIYIDSKTIEIKDGGHFVQEWSDKFLVEALDYLNE